MILHVKVNFRFFPAVTIATRARPTVLQVVLQRQRGRTHLPWRKLCLDILSVLCGLRPTAMLDYAVVPRQVLLQLATAVRASAGPAGALLGHCQLKLLSRGGPMSQTHTAAESLAPHSSAAVHMQYAA